MAKYPALPIWTDALMGDTPHLSNAEFGAYMLLLITAWRRPSCDLPDDNKFLAAVARVDGRGWRHLRPVLEKFHDVSDGVWVQKRLKKERKFADELSKRQSARKQAYWNKIKSLPDTTVEPRLYHPKTKTISNSSAGLRESPKQLTFLPVDKNGADAPSTLGVTLPDWMPMEAWDGYVAMRSASKHPLSSYAVRIAVAKLTKLRDAGHDPREVLDHCTLSAYRGIFPPSQDRATGRGPQRVEIVTLAEIDAFEASRRKPK